MDFSLGDPIGHTPLVKVFGWRVPPGRSPLLFSPRVGWQLDLNPGPPISWLGDLRQFLDSASISSLKLAFRLPCPFSQLTPRCPSKNALLPILGSPPHPALPSLDLAAPPLYMDSPQA